ncbi:MAG: xylulokinase [candidate division WOR-3 bacterium]|nr:xylulokinase [candidate division WOR-3 bacterium]
MSLLLGIDIGTSGSKAVLIAPDGGVRAEATTEYPIAVPRPGWAEQEPEDWWQATVASIRQVLAHAGGDSIAGIGLTGQMHGLVLLDEAGKVLRPCIMWNDQRTAAQCAEIEQKVGRARLIELAGKPALTGFTAGKILWVRENEPAVYGRARHVLLPKDYVRYRLTGEFAMDVADGSGTLLMDVGNRVWSDELLGLLDIPCEWLPPLHESHEVVAEVSAAAASATGLRAGTPVVAGAGDQAAQSIGTGIAHEGIVSVTIGTSGVVFAATSKYAFDPTGGLHAYCHAVPDTWHLMGVTLSAGGSLRWFRDALCEPEKAEAARTGRDVYDIITELASTAPAGSDGLLFLPYLTGERTPHADPDARGVFFGLSLRHGKAHMARAVIEGVTFSLRECLDLLCGLGQSCIRVRVSGGGSRSAFWRQVMADVFGVEIVEVNVTQGAAYGAALLAGVGTGVFSNAEQACERTVRETCSTKPGPNAGAYADTYERYRALYPALAPEFKRAGQTGS